MSLDDARRSAPAALRNRDPILAVLGDTLPPSGRVLEVASGTGEHALHFARALPGLHWQPSDPSPDARKSIEAWRAAEGPANLSPPLDVDVEHADWWTGAGLGHPLAALLAINMVHISPWAATLGLMAGASRLLGPDGILYLYGPYRRAGHDFAPGNAAFDRDLRRRDPAWGIRPVEAVEEAAADAGLRLDRIVEMPANNLSLIFSRDGS